MPDRHGANVNVSQLEAAVRQYREGILLYFEERDIFASYTLVCAAEQVFRDLAKRAGKDAPLAHVLRRVKREYRAEMHDAMALVKNWLKHADKDKWEGLRQNAANWEGLVQHGFLGYALHAYLTHALLTEKRLVAGSVFWTWALIEWPEYFEAGTFEILRARSGPAFREDLLRRTANCKGDMATIIRLVERAAGGIYADEEAWAGARANLSLKDV
ncbi:MAG: hypothetical protein R3C71_09885 [Candidatus Krumholzibacteriia bacterium]